MNRYENLRAGIEALADEWGREAAIRPAPWADCENHSGLAEHAAALRALLSTDGEKAGA